MNFECKYSISELSKVLHFSLEDTAELYSELINEMKSSIYSLKEAHNNNNYVYAKKILHDIKGVCGNFKINDIFEQAAIIIGFIKNENYDAANFHLNNLYIMHEISIAHIVNYFNNRDVKIN